MRLEFAGGQIQLEVPAAEGGGRLGVAEMWVLVEVPIAAGWLQLEVAEMWVPVAVAGMRVRLDVAPSVCYCCWT